MEEWDLLRIYHPFEFWGTNTSHFMVIESTDTNEVSFIYSHLREVIRKPESRSDDISRDKHIAKISFYEYATDNIGEYIYPDNKKDRPYERDIYWGVFVLLRSRGWKPFGERGLFIRYKEVVPNEK